MLVGGEEKKSREIRRFEEDSGESWVLETEAGAQVCLDGTQVSGSQGFEALKRETEAVHRCWGNRDE